MMDTNRDRNLLFGILAVQLRGVQPAQLVEAAAAWAVDPSRSLAERMVDKGLIGEADRELRDRDPALITALMHPTAMTIPPCEEEDGSVRAATIGPVFFVDAEGRLGMRYTARKRHVHWREAAATRAAAAALIEITTDDPAILRTRLEPGVGVLCNNVLHDRAGFADADDPAEGRLLLRLRSLDLPTFA